MSYYAAMMISACAAATRYDAGALERLSMDAMMLDSATYKAMMPLLPMPLLLLLVLLCSCLRYFTWRY